MWLIIAIIGFITGFVVATWVAHKLMDAYLDYRIEQIFPKETTVMVTNINKANEVPALIKEIEKIKTPQQLN